jgi:hypothetical protein
MIQETEYGLGKPMYLPCGGVAYFDQDSGISYRCHSCFAVVGSIGQPRSCKEEAKKWEAWKELGGKGWDYSKGESYAVDSKCVSSRHT